jgi:hypothetical protein
MLKLPAEGRQGEPPAWPLSRATGLELEMWAALWACPQAVAWERLGVGTVRVVARYVRLLREAERAPSAKGPSVAGVQNRGEVRQLEDRLGLTPMAMLRLRWEIVPDEVGEARAERDVGTAAPSQRFRAVE